MWIPHPVAALSLSSAAILRLPAVRLLVNGELITGVISAEITSTNYFSADCFCVKLAVGTPPLSTPAFWSDAAPIDIEIQFSLDALNYTSIISGSVDSAVIDPLCGTVQVMGRDSTSVLIESVLEQSFSNRTSSEIVEVLTAQHDLSCSATSTTTLVGRYYEGEHDRLMLDQFSNTTTEWDLLVFLARQEDFDLFFEGSTLVFQPTGLSSSNQLFRPEDMVSLSLQRSLVLSRDIEVTFKSWNSRQQTSFVQSLYASGDSDGNAPPIRYQFVRPNLTADQLMTLASRKITELASHERSVILEIPGELDLTPRDKVTIDGTGTEFDQTFQIRAIRRRFHPRTGFTQQIRCTSMTPRAITMLSAPQGTAAN